MSAVARRSDACNPTPKLLMMRRQTFSADKNTLLLALAFVALSNYGCQRKGALQQGAPSAAPPPTTGLFQPYRVISNTESAHQYGLQAIKLGSNVNTQFPDLAPFRYADKLYFASGHVEKKGIASTHIYAALRDYARTEWSANSKEAGVSTTQIAFSPNGQRVYYTLCADNGDGKGVQCEIYTRDRNYEGGWLPLRRLPRQINLAGFTTQHPSVGFDQQLKKEVLYFSTNRPGGKGGLDIWFATIETDGTYGTPQNLPINSPLDDVTPYFHQSGQTLFFSSNRPGTEGGLDVFKAQKSGPNNWGKPIRLEAPINSSFDDIYLTCHAGSGKAYFSSNRPDLEKPDSLQTLAGHDIYEVTSPVEMDAQALDAASSKELDGVIFTLTDLTAQMQVSKSKPIGNLRRFMLEPNKKYSLVTSLDGYLTDSTVFETTHSDVFSILKKEVRLKPVTVLIVQAYNNLDSLPISGVDYLGVGEDGKSFTLQKNEQTGEHYATVGLGEKLAIQVSKPGFATTSLNYEAPINKQALTVSQRVYLQPFSTLPLALYFDNDQPRWVNPSDIETKLNYEQTLRSYRERKQVFVEKQRDSLNTKTVEDAQKAILSFFEKELEGNFNKLDSLCQQLEQYLKKGLRLEILVEGEASPTASSDYNQRLVSRRINSFRNQLKSWNNGALKSYLYTGNLTVQGSFRQYQTTAGAPTFSNNEFSLDAALMRRIVIKQVTVQKPKV